MAHITRARNGNPLKLLDGDAYVALVDTAGQECSERIAGRVWLAFNGNHGVSILFNPDELDLKGGADLHATRPGLLACHIFLDGQSVATINEASLSYGKHDVLHVRWGDAVDELIA